MVYSTLWTFRGNEADVAAVKAAKAVIACCCKCLSAVIIG